MQVCTLEQHLSCLSHPPSLVNIILLSVFMNLTFVDSSYDIIQDLAFSVWHFTWHDVLKVHWCCHKRQDVLPEYSRLSSVWLHIHMPYLCHSSTDGHLGYFHTLTIVNNAAINMGGHMYFHCCVLISFGYIPRSGIARLYGRSWASQVVQW